MLSLLCIAFIGLSVIAEPRWQQEKDHSLQVKGGIATPNLEFGVVGPGPDVTYIANSPSLPFVAVAYRNLGLTLQVPSKPEEDAVRRQGRTRIQDFQFRFFGHRSTHELIYQYFKGYSIQDWRNPDGSPVIRENARVRHWAYNYFSAVSPDYYSKAVAFDQSGVQLRQGGSLFLWGSTGHTEISDSEAMVPSFVTQGRNRIGELTDFRMYHLLAGVGYGHMFPLFTRYYFTLSLFTGAGAGWHRANLQEDSNWDMGFIHRLGLRTGLGYNYGNHLGGFQLLVDQNTAEVSDGAVTQATLAGRLFYGYRFQDVSIPALDRWLD